VKICPLVTPPPGVGLETVILYIPATNKSEVYRVVVSVVEFIYVVVRAAPFILITEVGTKFVPLAVRVNCPPPFAAETGEIVLRVGAGFTVITVKILVAEIPPPGAGVTNLILKVPAVVNIDEGMVARKKPGMIVVDRFVPLN
jgi:hypothetical protein